MTVKPPVCMDEALSIPTCGVHGVWKEKQEAFFFSNKVVSELSRMGALMLYSLWEPKEEWCMSTEEMIESGMQAQIAAQLREHLPDSLHIVFKMP